MARLPFRRSAKRDEPAGQPVDPTEEPSVDWGWHRTFPRAGQVAGWICAISLLLMILGNHEGTTENLWLLGIASVMILGLLHDLRKRRTSWRR